MEEAKGPILHVLVVGFHHKKGCQVEYSYPALVPGAPNECPPGWKYLPTLALPDGSHNFDDDTAFFHLPSLTHSKKTVYGISCFRQIPVEKLKNRTEDITRGTVQKSVCVLSSLPLYGHIEVKMSLITHAYFDEGDFSKVSLLEDTYHHLNACLMQNNSPLQNFVGLSARDFILQWRHKAVLLYKLLLLERRLVFFKSPVQPLCTTILTLLSLHPGMIEQGLDQSACIKLSRPMSPMPDFEEDSDNSNTNSPTHNHQIVPPERLPLEIETHLDNSNAIEICIDTSHLTLNNAPPEEEFESNLIIINGSVQDNDDEVEKIDQEKIDVDGVVDLGEREEKSSLPRDSSMDTIADASAHSNMTTLTHVNIENCGIPLPLFAKGYLCLPYLSLPYIDLLGDMNVRGYIVGATNVLFKQKRQLADVLIEIDGARIESQDADLRRQLHLTTEDLRFADFVVKHVQEEKHDVFLDGVGWEGGDEWIRAQFRVYLLCLLRTSLLQEGSREIEHYNSTFMSSWKETHNYKMWFSGEHPGIFEVNPGHPFAGQLSVADMKLRFAHTMQNTESGRKINQAMASTGRAVATTGRAVELNDEGLSRCELMNVKGCYSVTPFDGNRYGIISSTHITISDNNLAGVAIFCGAISHAKGALSNWWTNLLVSPDNRPAICEGEDALHDIANPETDITCQTVVDVNVDIPVVENNKKNRSVTNIPESCEKIDKSTNNTIIIPNGDLVAADRKDDIISDHNIAYESGAIQTV